MKRIKIEETDSWQKPIISISNNGTATKGNRYIVGGTPTDEFSGFITDSIVTYDGTAWLEDVPESGWVVYDLNQDLLLIFESNIWKNAITAAASVDTSNFNNNLSSADDTVQKALETIDDLTIGSGGGESGSGVNFDTVATPQDLDGLAQNTGDWAYVTNIAKHVVRLGSSWRQVGNLLILNTGAGNLYGEQAHYDASAISGLLDGEAVTTWDDLSGSGYNMTAVSTGAIYKTGIVNGYPVVRFSASSAHVMRIAAKAFANGTSDLLTVVVVIKAASNHTGGIISTRPSLTGFSLRYSSTTNLNYYHTSNGAAGNIAVTDQFNVVWFRRSAANAVVAGVNDTTNILSVAPTGFTASTDTWTQIGTESDGSALLNADMAELFIFESAPNDTVLGGIITDLKTKYAIT